MRHIPIRVLLNTTIKYYTIYSSTEINLDTSINDSTISGDFMIAKKIFRQWDSKIWNLTDVKYLKTNFKFIFEFTKLETVEMICN